MNIYQLGRGFILIGFLGAVFITNAHAAKSSALRYNFVEGKTNVYSVQIESRGESGRETWSGNIFIVTKGASSNVFRLQLRGNLMPRREPGNVMMSGPMRMPMNLMLQEGTELLIDERGRVLRAGTDVPLTIPLGQLARAFFEVLPESGSRWEIEDNTFVMDDPLNTGPLDGYMSSPYGMMPFYGGRPGPGLVAVKRRVNYQVKDTSGDLVNIRKEIELESRLRTGEEPRAAASGEGVLIFDAVKGLFRQIDIEFNSSGRTETVVRKSSGSLRVRLLEGKELETALSPPPPAPVSQELTSAEFEKVLSDLKGDDSSARHSAANRLREVKVETISAESLDTLAALLSDTDTWVRQAVANFISKNGGTDSVPYLVKLLKDSDHSVRQSAVKGLARHRDARAAAPLAEMVARGQYDVQEASSALAKIGPDAEDAVLELLKEKYIETRRRACGILGQIGTAKSIEPLKNLMIDADQSLTQAAGEAVRAIQLRL